MITFSTCHKARKVIAGLCLALTLCGQAAGGAQPRPDYVVTPDAYRDTYILTQIFYSAFSLDDLTSIQQAVSQGLLACPDDFRRFMALSMELLKTADSRLFMLLAPLAPYMANQSEAIDFASLIRLTDILSGSVQAGQAQNATDSGAVGNEIFTFTILGNGATESRWTRPGNDGHTLVGFSASDTLPDSSVRGEARANVSGQNETEAAFFMVRGGIITFVRTPDRPTSEQVK